MDPDQRLESLRVRIGKLVSENEDLKKQNERVMKIASAALDCLERALRRLDELQAKLDAKD